ncbi:hypothetical protein AJ79_01345 [Helicocarpus griseus UAMH5409]|uniref:Indoleamine 2,3-dioxygenase n=1 Tax=Helicocarpus griseus UAMH5409 TaxID=1447875 RepID=A0A2B7Y7C9_9EURO|nr:hypothetical protein AJ79_01345 [Helicocarpus griseus UAMH5409]
MVPIPLIPDSAWLLAQASLAVNHKAIQQSVSKLRIPGENTRPNEHSIVIGPGYDGGLTRSTGFLSGFQQEPSLPSAFEAWETAVAQLPLLLRQGCVHKVVDRLPPLRHELEVLEERSLTRAAIVISSILQSYAYELRNLGNDGVIISLPENLAGPWDYVCSKLGRPQTARMIADDILNNFKRVRGRLAHAAVEYFDIQEERMSAGLQIEMEDAFSPALEMMTNVHKVVLARDDTNIVTELGKISACIISCAETFFSVPFIHGADGFDPVFWGKTYPEIGRPLRKDALPNSGVNSPLFHALDTFLGTLDPKADLHVQQYMRRSIMPYPVRRFLEALEDPRYSIRSYVENGAPSTVNAALDAVVQMYTWFLERHRLRAIAAISIALASGRPRTAGGAQQGAFVMPVDEMLNRQMEGAIETRFRERSRTLTPKVVEISPAGNRAISLKILLPCPLPVEVGDRLQIWPRNKLDHEELARIQGILGRKVEASDLEPLASRDLRALFETEIPEGISRESVIERVPTLRPRHYTVSQVEKNIHGLSQGILLTIARSDGISAQFLHNSVPGQILSTRLIPEPNFRPPLDHSRPLLLIAQGAGVGPFLGYLKQRLGGRTGRNLGDVILILCARQLEDVPYLSELSNLTGKLPLALHLALSRTESRVIVKGKETRLAKIEKAQNVLARLEADIKSKCEEEGYHIHVSGGASFGYSVRSKLQSMGVVDESRYHEDCFGGHPAFASSREVMLEELSLHNTPDSLWTAIDGIVYDLTVFANDHPGGLKTLIESAGTVADRRFHLIHSGDLSQGIISQIAQYAVGSLRDGDLSPVQAEILSQIVIFQNILRNNTSCAQGREMPFFIYADSLFVTKRDLEKLAKGIQGSNASVALFTELEEYFAALKSCAWEFLANSLEISLPDRQNGVLSIYSALWKELHVFFNDLKQICCSKGEFSEIFGEISQNRVARMVRITRVGIEALKSAVPQDESDHRAKALSDWKLWSCMAQWVESLHFERITHIELKA